jgi:uncharacterized protein YjbK
MRDISAHHWLPFLGQHIRVERSMNSQAPTEGQVDKQDQSIIGILKAIREESDILTTLVILKDSRAYGDLKATDFELWKSEDINYLIEVYLER